MTLPAQDIVEARMVDAPEMIWVCGDKVAPQRCRPDDIEYFRADLLLVQNRKFALLEADMKHFRARADALAQEVERQTDRFAAWHEQMAVDAASAPDGDAQSRFHRCCAGLIRNDPHVRAALRSLQGGEDA